MPDTIQFYRNQAGLAENESLFAEDGCRILLSKILLYGGRSQYECKIDTVLDNDYLEHQLRHRIKQWLLADVYSFASITHWLDGNGNHSKIVLGDGAKAGLVKGFTPGLVNYCSPDAGIPTIPPRLPLALGALELNVEDEMIFDLTPPRMVLHQAEDMMANAMQIVVTVMDIIEDERKVNARALRDGTMCRYDLVQ